MLSFFLFFGILYALMIRALGNTWRIQTLPATSEVQKLEVSIIIPYRNESANIPTLLESISNLTYRPLELILVNDHSEDGSQEIVKTCSETLQQAEIPLIHVDSTGVGKKAAILAGMRQASGEIAVLTDADCQFCAEWIQGVLVPFSEGEVHLVAGPVSGSGNGRFFDKFQQIEWASILLITHFGFSVGKPITCSAANLAFRKSSFLQVNGFEGNTEIPTGDDEFLLKKFVEAFGSASAIYLPSAQVLVQTKLHASSADMLSQRVRWASKWRLHKSWFHALVAFVSFLWQLFWLGSIGLFWAGWLGIAVFVLIWGLKIVYEFGALNKVLSGFASVVPVWSFVLTSILHPWYVLATAFSTLFLNYTWKGRKYAVKP